MNRYPRKDILVERCHVNSNKSNMVINKNKEVIYYA